MDKEGQTSAAVEENESPNDSPRVAEVVEWVARGIIEGRLQPGDDLNSVDLAKRFSLSRTPVTLRISKLLSTGFMRQARKPPVRAWPAGRERVCPARARQARQGRTTGTPPAATARGGSNRRYGGTGACSRCWIEVIGCDDVNGPLAQSPITPPYC